MRCSDTSPRLRRTASLQDRAPVEDATEIVVRPSSRSRPCEHASGYAAPRSKQTNISISADVHADLVTVAGTPPFQIRLGDQSADSCRLEELRAGILAVAQKGVDYVRFKGLGEIGRRRAPLIRRPWILESRTLVQVTDGGCRSRPTCVLDA